MILLYGVLLTKSLVSVIFHYKIKLGKIWLTWLKQYLKKTGMEMRPLLNFIRNKITVNDGKIGCITVKYTTALLFSNWAFWSAAYTVQVDCQIFMIIYVLQSSDWQLKLGKSPFHQRSIILFCMCTQSYIKVKYI